MSTNKKKETQLNNQISLRIKELRESREPIQAKFAADNLIDRQLLSRWESISDTRGVSIHTIKKFCDMIEISLFDFFDHESFR